MDTKNLDKMIKKDLLIETKKLIADNKSLSNQVNQLKSKSSKSTVSIAKYNVALKDIEAVQLRYQEVEGEAMAIASKYLTLQERCAKVDSVIANVRDAVKEGQPYYFVQFRKNWLVVKYVFEQIKTLF